MDKYELEAFREYTQYAFELSKCSVGIFWDFENVNIPMRLSADKVAHQIRNIAASFGIISTFKCYVDVESMTTAHREGLQQSGVEIIDVPHMKSKLKDACDKTMLMDMTFWVCDHRPPAVLVLISGDRDFSLAINRFAQRMFKVVLITPQKRHVCDILTNGAFKVINFESIVGEMSTPNEQELKVEPTVITTTSIPVEDKSESHQIEIKNPVELPGEAESLKTIISMLYNSSGMPRRLPIQALKIKGKNDPKKIIQRHPGIFKIETVVSLWPDYEKYYTPNLKIQSAPIPVTQPQSVQAPTPSTPPSEVCINSNTASTPSGLNDETIKSYILKAFKTYPSINKLSDLKDKILEIYKANISTKALRAVMKAHLPGIYIVEKGGNIISAQSSALVSSPKVTQATPAVTTTPEHIVVEKLFELVSSKPAGIELTVLGNELKSKYPDIKPCGKLKAMMERYPEKFDIQNVGHLLFRVFAKGVVHQESVLSEQSCLVTSPTTDTAYDSECDSVYTSANEYDDYSDDCNEYYGCHTSSERYNVLKVTDEPTEYIPVEEKAVDQPRNFFSRFFMK